ncbi:hypothetical protein FGA82_16975 [Pseudomonas fluorescens]|nr:hypothetical protein FGA82_16975 [Pseudomonas fluorescens]
MFSAVDACARAGRSKTATCAASDDRSHALRGNASTDAPRSAFGRDAERPGRHSHAERGNDHGVRAM